MFYIKSFTILQRFINPDLGLIRHPQLFIVLFDTLHREDGRRRRPKRVGVVNKQS